MSDDIHVSVASGEEAAQLKEDFEEVIARVNGDLMSCTMEPGDPISVEAAIAFAERAVDHHLSTFADNAPLQSLGPEIRRRFRAGIEQQARLARERASR
ncbi:MAG TPA: hypothetical protein VKX25_08745 [Bryobacteraceae bacterium]|jgi:hypothetical protein|nr:hypothetical protein [Bryobacteraceae bacterium]